MFCLSKRRRMTRPQGSNSHLPSSPTEEIPIEDDAPLCSTCSALDLYAILRNVIPSSHAVPLGHLTDIFEKYDSCGLCHLVTTSIRRVWRLDELSGINLAGITCVLYTPHSLTLQPDQRDVHHNQLYIGTSRRPRGVTKILNAMESLASLEIQLLEEDASKVGMTKELPGRRVSRNVNIGLLKSWIHICENEHRERCDTVWWRGSGQALPKGMKILDVTRMAIVPAPPMCRYVALSYVWGGTGEGYWTTKANIKKRGKSGGLDASMLPATISDTIQLVRQLDERYLWIDALCIVQDDPVDKAAQICVMDLIYSRSAFTVFSAGSNSVQDPLSGIRPGTRDPKQDVVKIQGLHFVVPLPFLSEAITSSVWNERGWTYQELMLSRRRVFFTAHEVHFECVADRWCESVITEPVGYAGKHGDGTSSLSSLVSQSWHNDAYLRDYTEIIMQYTQRKLTVESDIVDAIAALFQALTKAYKLAGGDYGKAFRFGMPIVHLAEALLWQPTANASHSRRPADGIGAPWPSWSWAGWRGAVRYSDASVFVNIRQSSETDDGTFVFESLVQQWYIVDDHGQPVRQDIQLYGHTGECIENIDRSISYIAPNSDINLQQMIIENAPLRPGTLIFQTSSARFDVTRADDVAGAKAKTNYAIYSILMDIPRPSTLVGRVILPRSTSSPTSYEFIVLSRANHCKGLYDENALRKPYFGCMMYVMAVQAMHDERIMERVGVGVIVEQAWISSTSEEKVVFLG